MVGIVLTKLYIKTMEYYGYVDDVVVVVLT